MHRHPRRLLGCQHCAWVISRETAMEKGGNSYKIPEKSPVEKRDPLEVRAGYHGCWAQIWGDQVPSGCLWARHPPPQHGGGW